MARISKEQEWYSYGLARALEVVKNEGMEALEHECKMRGAFKSCPPMTDALKKIILEFEKEVKENCLATVETMALAVLRDEFGFGHKRLEQFMCRFDKITNSMINDMCNWEDYRDMLNEEAKLDLHFDFSKI